MAVPTGTASMLDIQNEFGGSAPISLSEYYGAASGVPTSGTISINDFRGKSGLLTLSSQGTAQNASFLNGSSISLALPSSAAGDLAIIVVGGTAGQSGGYPSLSVNLPSGWTSIYASQQSNFDGPYGKGGVYYVRAVRMYYKVLGSGETSVTHTFNKSGFTTMYYSISSHVYRPSSAISSVTVNDVDIDYASSISCSSASATTIAFKGTVSKNSLSHSWSAGPTNQNGLWYDSGEADTLGRLSTYVQNTSTPSNVTVQPNTSALYFRSVAGYLEVT